MSRLKQFIKIAGISLALTSVANIGQASDFQCSTLSFKLYDKIEDCSEETDVGQNCMINVQKIHPTQLAVGKMAVSCKSHKLGGKKYKKLKKYLMNSKRCVPAIIGPDGTFYLTDHHHLASALFEASHKAKKWEGKNEKLRVKVVNSYFNQFDGQANDEFWRVMINNNRAWPYAGNTKLDPDKFKKKMDQIRSVADLSDDPYRTISRWTRESCAYLKKGKTQCDFIDDKSEADKSDFMEFRWANYYRENLGEVAENNLTEHYEKAVKLTFDDKEINNYFTAKWGLDANEYGLNEYEKALNLKFEKKDEASCEVYTLDENGDPTSDDAKSYFLEVQSHKN